jgi:sulfoxide reductase catalytic subunit YedY
MTILIRRPSDIQPSEITPPEIFRRRRELLKAAGTALAIAGAGLPIVPGIGPRPSRSGCSA